MGWSRVAALSVGLGCAGCAGPTTPIRAEFPEALELVPFTAPLAGPAASQAELGAALGGTGGSTNAAPESPVGDPGLDATMMSGARNGLAAPRYVTLRHASRFWALAELGQDATDRTHSAFARLDDVMTGSFLVRAESHVFVAFVVTRGDSTPIGCEPSDDRAEAVALLCALSPAFGCMALVRLGPREYDEDNRLPSVQEALGACDETAYHAPNDPGPSEPVRTLRVATVDRLCIAEGERERCVSVGDVFAASRALARRP